MYRIVRWCVIVGLCYLTVHSIPSVARYIKMRSL
jgi:hypothetical protein